MRLLSEGSLENKKELEDTASLFISKIEATDTIFLEVETGAFCCLKRKASAPVGEEKLHALGFRQLYPRRYRHQLICLACDNPFDRSSVGADILKILDYIFHIVYEFLVKVLYFGFISMASCRTCTRAGTADLIIVVVGLLDALTTINLGFLRALRTIVLRPCA